MQKTNPRPSAGTKFAVMALLAVGVVGVANTAFGTGQYFKVDYPASTNPQEMRVAVTYTLWIPDGVKPFRGVIVHQHGAGMTASKEGSTAAYDLHWQALAKKWDCALLGPCYHVLNDGDLGAAGSEYWFDPRRGSAKTFLKSSRRFRRQDRTSRIGHGSLGPLGTFGRGGWADVMAPCHPERIVADLPPLRLGAGVGQARPSTPLPTIPRRRLHNPHDVHGRHEGRRLDEAAADHLPATTAPRARRSASPPTRGRATSAATAATSPFRILDACLAMRLPDKWSKDQTLKPVDMSQGVDAPRRSASRRSPRPSSRAI